MTYRVTEIAQGVWAIDEGMVQCFLIEGTEHALLIDSCMSGGVEFPQTVRELTSKPVSLVLTHTDKDHTGGQADFNPTYLHPSEFELVERKDDMLENACAIWEGQTFDLGGVELEVVLLPGHTPGSIALLDRANQRLFIGDSVSDAWIYLFGDGRSVPAFIASLKKLERLTGEEGALGPIATVHSAHGSRTLDPEWITRTRVAAQKLLAGELEGSDPPQSLPCKVYSYNGVNLLY